MSAIRTAAGLLVREARRDRGWNHDRMALEIVRHKELGPAYEISAKTIRNVEQGAVRSPYVRTAYAVATVLGLRVSDLWPETA